MILESDVFNNNSFTNHIDISVEFEDYDNDNLSYSWSIIEGNGSFTSTNGHEAHFHTRNAGTIIIGISVNDGFSDPEDETIAIYQPTPDVKPTVVITSRKSAGEGLEDITGYIQSPIELTVVINGVTAQTLLSSNPLLGNIAPLGDISPDTFEYYSFSANSVPVGNDPTQLNIEVFTNMDGESVEMELDSIMSSDDGSDSTDGQKEASGGDVDALSGFGMGGGGGCSISTGKADNHLWFLLLVIGIIPLRLLYKY